MIFENHNHDMVGHGQGDERGRNICIGELGDDPFSVGSPRKGIGVSKLISLEMESLKEIMPSISQSSQMARLRTVRVGSVANSYFVKRKNCCWALEISWS